jgi:hypothetical protein
VDTYEVSYMFNGTEHRVDVPAVSEAEAAFKVGQHVNADAEFRGARLLGTLSPVESTGRIMLNTDVEGMMYFGCHRMN